MLVRWKRVSFHYSLWQVLDVAIFHLIFFSWDIIIFPLWCPSSWSLSCCLAPSQQSLPLSQLHLSYISRLCSMDFLIALSLSLTISTKIWANIMQLCHSRTQLTAETVRKEGRLCCIFPCSPSNHPHGLYICSFNTLAGPGSETGNACCVALTFISKILCWWCCEHFICKSSTKDCFCFRRKMFFPTFFSSLSKGMGISGEQNFSW